MGWKKLFFNRPLDSSGDRIKIPFIISKEAFATK